MQQETKEAHVSDHTHQESLQALIHSHSTLGT